MQNKIVNTQKTKTRIALSFDDGAKDGYTNIFPLLKKYNFPATFNIVTGYLDGSTGDDKAPFETISWKMAREMHSSSMIEFADHSSDHSNNWEAIASGRETLISKLKMPADTMMGFASPKSKLSFAELLMNKDRFIGLGISYVRTGVRLYSHKRIRILTRKIGRVIHLGWIYKIAYHDTLLGEDDDFVLYSVPIMKDTTVNQIIALINHAESEGKSLILLLHRIRKCEEAGYDDNWCWDYRKFECLLRFLYNEQRRGRIEAVKTQDLANVKADSFMPKDIIKQR